VSEADALVRVAVPALDEVLGHKWPVLDDGFVRVVDYLGSDQSIVQAARVSYGAGTKSVHEDVGLIRYLMRHRHTTPFEMCEVKLHVRVPMDTWRQWIRHRTASVNEYSTRYSIAIDAAARTSPDAWRIQAVARKQGSDGELSSDVGADLSKREAAFLDEARAVYEERLAQGVAREQARKDLPLSTYTEAYWKADLHNLFHFLSLRMDAHAQLEIREYANVIGREIVARWCPTAWAAYCDYVLGAVTLTSREVSVIRAVVRGDAAAANHVAEDFGWLARDERGLRPNRERQEAEETLGSLGLVAPWRVGEAKQPS
jgi:thymidylate synthase (FAD)